MGYGPPNRPTGPQNIVRDAQMFLHPAYRRDRVASPNANGGRGGYGRPNHIDYSGGGYRMGPSGVGQEIPYAYINHVPNNRSTQRRYSERTRAVASQLTGSAAASPSQHVHRSAQLHSRHQELRNARTSTLQPCSLEPLGAPIVLVCNPDLLVRASNAGVKLHIDPNTETIDVVNGANVQSIPRLQSSAQFHQQLHNALRTMTQAAEGRDGVGSLSWRLAALKERLSFITQKLNVLRSDPNNAVSNNAAFASLDSKATRVASTSKAHQLYRHAPDGTDMRMSLTGDAYRNIYGNPRVPPVPRVPNTRFG